MLERGGKEADIRIPFVVEVAEDDLQAAILLTQEVVLGNENVLEGDVGSTCSRGVGCLDGLGLNAFLAFNQQNIQTSVVRSATNSEVVGEGTVGNPFLHSDV